MEDKHCLIEERKQRGTMYVLFSGTKAAPYAEDVPSDVKKANLTFPG
jgi:hypothetical protein